MLMKTISLIHRNICFIIFSIAILIYLSFTLPALWQDTHFLQNLEPYPDGLLYALTARNLAAGNSHTLQYLDSTSTHWAPPLYSYILTVGYLINEAPTTFYAINVVLGTSTLIILLYIIWKTTQNHLALGTGAILYLSHSYILWLPSVPMAENLTLLLFVIALGGITLPDKHIFHSKLLMPFFLFSALGLSLTKYANITLTPVFIILSLLHFKAGQSKHYLLVVTLIILTGISAFSIFIENPLTLLSNISKVLLDGNSPYHSFRFIWSNLKLYGHTLMGISSQFLWLTTPLTSIFLTFFFIFSVTWYWKKNTHLHLSEAIILPSLFIAQFTIPLTFYTVDSRYIVTIIPLFALGISWLITGIWQKRYAAYFATIFSILIAAHLLTQISLFKQIVANNILGRSTAWQYEAIAHFDQTFSQVNGDVFIITALPPFLVDAYSTSNYRVLPLSEHQEFIAKGEWVWGSDLDPYDQLGDAAPKLTQRELLTLFDDLLDSDSELYISNAYITHLHEVVADYEALHEKYLLEEVSPGCNEACTVFSVQKR